MRDSLIGRASWRAVAVAGSTFIAIGCGGGEAEPPGGGEPAPKKSVTSCSVESDVVVGTGKATSTAIAFHGGRFAVAWTDEGRDGGDVMLTVLGENGRVDRTVTITTEKEKSTSPAITATDDGFLVVWQDASDNGGKLRAARVDKDGALQGSAYTITETTGAEAHPAVVQTDAGPMVAWTEAHDAVVTMAGTGAPRARSTMPAGTQIALAGGDDAAAVWVDGSKIAFARIDAPPAQRTPTPMRFRNAAGRANLPRLAAGPDDDFAVVWEDARAGAEKEAVYLTHIDEDGRASREIILSRAGGSANTPDVAWLGDRAAVAYYQYRDGPSSIYLTLVDPEAGTVGNELRVSTVKGARLPRVIWAGGGKLGVTYAERGGPAHMAVVSCK